MFQVGSSSHGFTRSSPSSYSASHLNNRASATNTRPCIPHLRVDDEEVVLRKFDVGKKIGQVILFLVIKNVISAHYYCEIILMLC